jgi:succinyl-CoA synthetase alpha subunit
MRRIEVERSTYLDSVSLMRISKKAAEAERVSDAVVAMATDTNLSLMKDVGFDIARMGDVTPNDLVIAIDAEDGPALEAAMALVQAELKGGVSAPGEESHEPKDLNSMLREYAEINLVLISIPGRYAAYEAHKALRADRHVMIFSDNVSLEDEVSLKRLASSRGLLLMGPDCGTAIINGMGLGFANSVPAGKIGMVAASGTGAQEVSSILARHGLGISQLIGTGGRDISAEVGGISMIMGLEALTRDERTEVIVIVSKLPDSEVADRVLQVAGEGRKPCVVYFAGQPETARRDNLVFTRTLAETAREAALAAEGKAWEDDASTRETMKKSMMEFRQGLPRSRRALRGLFSGGTLAQEAGFIIGPALGSIHTNLKLPGFAVLEDPYDCRSW